MNRSAFPIALVLSLFGTPFAAGAPQIVAKVTYIGTYGNGRLFVGLDTQIQEAGCPNARFDVAADHPQIKNWTAVAIAAIASGKTVGVQTSGCMGVLPTMSQQSTDSFFNINSN